MSAVLNAMLLNIVWPVVLVFFVLAVIGTANWFYGCGKAAKAATGRPFPAPL